MCPICGRHFTRKNQQHLCELFDIEQHHLKKVSIGTKQLYHLLISKCRQFGPITLEPLKTIIALKKHTQFCSIQVQKQALKLIFRSYSRFNSSRFAATSQQADRMYYYQLKIKNLGDIDEEVLGWLKQAYIEN